MQNLRVNVSHMEKPTSFEENWRQNGRLLRAQYNLYRNVRTSQGYILLILQHFTTKLGNLMNFKMLFRAVVKDLVRLAWIRV